MSNTFQDRVGRMLSQCSLLAHIYTRTCNLQDINYTQQRLQINTMQRQANSMWICRNMMTSNMCTNIQKVEIQQMQSAISGMFPMLMPASLCKIVLAQKHRQTHACTTPSTVSRHPASSAHFQSPTTAGRSLWSWLRWTLSCECELLPCVLYTTWSEWTHCYSCSWCLHCHTQEVYHLHAFDERYKRWVISDPWQGYPHVASGHFWASSTRHMIPLQNLVCNHSRTSTVTNLLINQSTYLPLTKPIMCNHSILLMTQAYSALYCVFHQTSHVMLLQLQAYVYCCWHPYQRVLRTHFKHVWVCGFRKLCRAATTAVLYHKMGICWPTVTTQSSTITANVSCFLQAWAWGWVSNFHSLVSCRHWLGKSGPTYMILWKGNLHIHACK